LARADDDCYPWEVDAFTDQEEAFFREGDAMSMLFDAVPIAEIIDLPSYRPRGVERAIEVSDYYASFTLTIEAEEMSGGFEVAA
jgi:hypothetical protein